jgi:hypothetical protein
MDNLEPHITRREPEKAERSYIWHAAIGLQQVDGPEPSGCLVETANQNINRYSKAISERPYHCWSMVILNISTASYGSLPPFDRIN